MFRQNRSLDDTILRVAEEVGMNPFERFILRFRLAVMWRPKRRQLEEQITEFAVKTGAILPQATESGVYVGDWRDMFQWFLDNWEEIFKIILALISLFGIEVIIAIIFILELL